MGTLIQFEEYSRRKGRNAGNGKSCVLQSNAEVLIALEVSKRTAKAPVVVRFKQNVLDKMVLGKSEVCPVHGCNRGKHADSWVCESCFKVYHGDLSRAARKYVVEKYISDNNNGIDPNHRYFKLLFDVLVDVAIEMKKYEFLDDNVIFEKILADHPNLPEFFIQNAIDKAIKAVHSSGWVPRNVWNDLFEVAMKAKKSGKSDQEIRMVVSRRIPINWRQNSEKIERNIVGALNKHLGNIRKN